jgi:CxxC-x17-CxxC domain-containing protein
MHDAVCDNCGVATQVPFLPSQDRPVYCSDCFSKVKPARSSW